MQAPRTLQEAIQREIEDPMTGRVGIHVVDLGSGHEVFSHNADQTFLLSSLTKILKSWRPPSRRKYCPPNHQVRRSNATKDRLACPRTIDLVTIKIPLPTRLQDSKEEEMTSPSYSQYETLLFNRTG